MENGLRLLSEAQEHLFVQEHTAAARAVQAIMESEGGRGSGDPVRRFGGWTAFHCDGGDDMVAVGTVEVDGRQVPLALYLNREPLMLGRETLVLSEVPGEEVSEFARTPQGFLRCSVGSRASEEDLEALARKILRRFVGHIRRIEAAESARGNVVPLRPAQAFA